MLHTSANLIQKDNWKVGVLRPVSLYEMPQSVDSGACDLAAKQSDSMYQAAPLHAFPLSRTITDRYISEMKRSFRFFRERVRSSDDLPTVCKRRVIFSRARARQPGRFVANSTGTSLLLRPGRQEIRIRFPRVIEIFLPDLALTEFAIAKSQVSAKPLGNFAACERQRFSIFEKKNYAKEYNKCFTKKCVL